MWPGPSMHTLWLLLDCQHVLQLSSSHWTFTQKLEGGLRSAIIHCKHLRKPGKVFKNHLFQCQLWPQKLSFSLELSISVGGSPYRNSMWFNFHEFTPSPQNHCLRLRINTHYPIITPIKWLAQQALCQWHVIVKAKIDSNRILMKSKILWTCYPTRHLKVLCPFLLGGVLTDIGRSIPSWFKPCLFLSQISFLRKS